MYHLGGEYPDGSASRAMWRYDPVLNAWHEMAGMNVCRYVLDSVMYRLIIAITPRITKYALVYNILQVGLVLLNALCAIHI